MLKKYIINHGFKFSLLSLIILSVTSCGGSNSNNTDKTVFKADSIRKTATTPKTTGHLISAWHDETIKTDKGEQIAYELVSKGNKLYIQAITFTGNNLKLDDIPPVSPSASEIKKEGDKYLNVANAAESYSIDKAGDLHIYDSGRLIAVCKKIL